MLEHAIKHTEILKQKYADAICDEYFKYYRGGNVHFYNLEIDEND